MSQRIINGVDFTDTLTPSEVSQVFRVSGKTVARWAKEGRLATIRTLGGHRRFSRAQVETLLHDGMAGADSVLWSAS